MPLVSLQDVANKHFDYIVAGGGTAGLVVAARLSEDPKVNVLVLEAGPANLNDDLIRIPAQIAQHFGKPSYDWNLVTTVQESSDSTQFGWHIGKGLGGSSAINFMCWTKPPAGDIDDLEKLGNVGWNWDTYDKYLKKAENFIHLPKEVLAARGISLDKWKTNSFGGPLNNGHQRTVLDVELKAVKALSNLGVGAAENPMGGDPKGFFSVPTTVDPVTNCRSYSVTAYYLPNQDRPNLHILVNANVNKIHSDDKSPGDFVATGVEFAFENSIYVAHATKEVIVSSGSTKSPQILELSGIGRRDVLEAIKVPVKVELPGVGENLQEHLHSAISYEIHDDVPAETFDLLRDPVTAAKHLALHPKGTGIFNMGVTALSFNPLEVLTDKHQEIKDGIKAEIERDIKAAIAPVDPPAPGKRYLSLVAATNYNFSRGSIHSVSNDPNVSPAINPRYFSRKSDLKVLVEMVKFNRKLATTAPLTEVFGTSPKEVNPGPNVQTDEEIANWIKKVVSSTFHPAGTCSMLPKELDGVVDPTLKVYGTKNVRVVDLSIIPVHFGTHAQSTVYAIAEQAADIIKGAK
ncbi:GMC oxidoreductase family protein [Pleurotus pulmonarius]